MNKIKHIFQTEVYGIRENISIQKKSKKASAGKRHLENRRDKVWRRQWHPTPVLLPGKSHGRRSLVGCRPWGR